MTSQNSYTVFVPPAVLLRGYVGVHWRRLHENKTFFMSCSSLYYEGEYVSLKIHYQSGADQAN